MNYYTVGGFPEEYNRRKRGEDPAISIYLINDRSPGMEKVSCMWCKRTIADIHGRIDKIVDAPIDANDFGIAVNIRCKLCHQNYRLVISQSFIGAII